MNDIIDLTPKTDKIFPNAVVALKGILSGFTIMGIVVKVHPPGTLMTDPTGEEREWRGRMPIIDAVTVERRKIDESEFSPFEAVQPRDVIKIGKGYFSKTEGDILVVQKIPWAVDIERAPNFKLLPPMIVARSPRYLVVGEVRAG
jgi:hypothetical protein